MSRNQSRGMLARIARRDESGMAMVLVVGSMLVLAMLAMTALAYSLQSQQFARYTQDHGGAMAAAQSGIEDYISRLNRDDQYWKSVDCSNVALQGPAVGANSCGWTATTPEGWLPVVPGETDPEAAWFHYSVDSSMATSQRMVLVRSTGRVNGEYRTIEAAVGKAGSTDYVYYTDFESADPSNIQAYPPGSSNPASRPEGGASQNACGAAGYQNALYWWQGRNGYRCQEIQFVSGDKLNGGVYTNDAAWSTGAEFLAGFYTHNPGCNGITSNQSTWRNCLRTTGGVSPSSTANFWNIRPQYADQKRSLDDTSAEFANHPGCHYYGATRVVFNSDGTMNVWNKTSNNGNRAPDAIPATGLPTPSCGTLAALDSAAGARVAVPDQMVIYVAAAPSAQNRQCNSGEIGGPTGRTLPIGNYDRALHNSSTRTQYAYDVSMAEPTKYCSEGNLYAEGVLKGRVTLAAAASIVVTGDLVLAEGRNGNDLLGLVATNSVEVLHPLEVTYSWQNRNAQCVDASPRSYRYCPNEGIGSDDEVSGWPRRYADPTTGTNVPSTGVQIAGSIQTLQHSFLVQQYGIGPAKGQLVVFGSIAQRWRGIVGSTDGNGMHGYLKLYEYDPRLVTSAPPYFPRWVNAQWGLRYSGEINTPADVRS